MKILTQEEEADLYEELENLVSSVNEEFIINIITTEELTQIVDTVLKKVENKLTYNL